MSTMHSATPDEDTGKVLGLAFNMNKYTTRTILSEHADDAQRQQSRFAVGMQNSIIGDVPNSETIDILGSRGGMEVAIGPCT